MFKKFAALLLTLLLCASLLPGKTNAAVLPDAPTPYAQMEPAKPETPDEPECPVMPAWADTVPGDLDEDHIGK